MRATAGYTGHTMLCSDSSAIILSTQLSWPPFTNKETQNLSDDVPCPEHTAGVRGNAQSQSEPAATLLPTWSPGHRERLRNAIRMQKEINSKFKPLSQQTQKHKTTVTFSPKMSPLQ